MLAHRILLSGTVTGTLALRAALPNQDGGRHQGMVAVLDADGVVVEVGSPWGGIAPGSAYMHCVERAIGEIKDPGGRDELANAVADVLSGRQVYRSIDLRCAAGSGAAWFRIVVTPRSVGARDGVVVAHAPAPGEKARDAELKDIERRLNEIYSIADIGDFEYVAAEDRTRLSPPVLRMFGLPSDASGKSDEFFSTVHPEDRQRVMAIHQDPSWRQTKAEFRVVHPDGEVRNIAVTMRREIAEAGEIVRVFGINHDVTGRRQAEERLDRLFEASIDILSIISFRGLFKRVNPAFAASLGYSEEELCARPAIEFVHPDDRERTLAEVQAQLFQASKHRIENRYVRKDGSLVRLAWTMSSSGRDILGVARDITAEHAAAEELRRAKEAAEAASTAKSDFLATMSHEIRTPLNAVIGMAELLRTTVLTPEQRGHAETIHESGQLLLTLLNDVLDLSRIEAGKLELETRSFDLHHALKSASELWAPMARAKGLTLECVLAKDLPRTVEGDETRVRQIVSNLVSNAVKFTARGSVTLSGSSEGERVAIGVRDTGCGIDSDVLPKLFQKFSQGDASVTRQHGGTGLGLAICKRLAEMMGGTISVASEKGAGSTFTVDLALRQVSTTSEAKHEAKVVAENSRGLHVLVAEDNSINRKLIEHMLEALGHTCDFAEDGEQAVARAGERTYDAILMDVQMPVLDGISAARQIRAFDGAASRTHIIAVTANAMTGDREKYLAARMDGYVSKPISMNDLARALDRARSVASVPKAARA